MWAPGRSLDQFPPRKEQVTMVTVGASSAAAQGCSLLQAWGTPGPPNLPRPHLEEQLQAAGEGLAAQISASAWM